VNKRSRIAHDGKGVLLKRKTARSKRGLQEESGGHYTDHVDARQGMGLPGASDRTSITASNLQS